MYINFPTELPPAKLPQTKHPPTQLTTKPPPKFTNKTHNIENLQRPTPNPLLTNQTMFTKLTLNVCNCDTQTHKTKGKEWFVCYKFDIQPTKKITDNLKLSNICTQVLHIHVYSILKFCNHHVLTLLELSLGQFLCYFLYWSLVSPQLAPWLDESK